MSFDVKYDAHGNVVSADPSEESQGQVSSAFLPQPDAPEELVSENDQDTIQIAPKPNNIQENFARLRQKAEAAERRNEELERQLAAAQTQYNEPEEDLNLYMSDDDLAEGRHLSKVEKKIQKLENKISQYEYQNNQVAIENSIKVEYPDFYEVVSKANVQRLADEYPEILATLKSSKDLYAQGISAYTMIKKLGIVPDDGMASLSRIKANSVKPKTASSISTQRGETPLAKANPFAEGLTPELKAALLKEMNDSMRNRF